MVWRDGSDSMSNACKSGTRYVPGCILYPTSVLPCPLPQGEEPYLVLDDSTAYRWAVLRRVFDETEINRARRVRDENEKP